MTFERPAFDPAQAVALARKTFEIEAAAVLGLGARIGPEFADAVQAIFDVKVLKVNTLNRKGKSVRNRRTGITSKRPDAKRAIVTLAEGDSIDLFEGA